MDVTRAIDPVVRPAAVAGSFYPREPDTLARDVQRYLAAARQLDAGSGPAPKALIVPHAGYIYSGEVAAHGYSLLFGVRRRVSRVVLMGPAHRLLLRGLATSSAGAFSTPLGEVAVDTDVVAALSRLPQVEILDAAHASEHALEVHLPFLQMVLERFAIVPLVVGEASPREVSEVLDASWGGPETLIVVSSDLSHYHDYRTAQRLDRQTTRAIESLDEAALAEGSACGRAAIAGLLVCARRRGLSVATLDVRNSGDTAGPTDRVVGYGSYALY